MDAKRTSQFAATVRSQGRPQKEETDQVEELRTSTSERVVENAQPAASSTSPVPAAVSDNTSDYPQLFANADESTRATLSWANEYLTDPDVAAWMQDCAKWHTAVTTGNYQNRKERRKLFKETDVPCTRAFEQNAEHALKVIGDCATKTNSFVA